MNYRDKQSVLAGLGLIQSIMEDVQNGKIDTCDISRALQKIEYIKDIIETN